MKILITGGAGFIGSHLVRRLLSDGHSVIVIDNLFTGSRENLSEFEDNPRFTFHLHDVQQPFICNVDVIYHLACPASPPHYQKNPLETAKTAALGVMHMLDLALRTKARILYASTSEIYGDPVEHPQRETYWGNVNTVGVRSCYDEGKRFGETLCADYWRLHGVDVRIVRIFNTYGPGMNPQDGRVVSNFILQALRGNELTIFGTGKQTRSFQYVDDLIEAFVRYMGLEKHELSKRLADAGWHNVPVLNLGNPDEFTMLELAQEVQSQVGNSSKIMYYDLPADDPKQRQPDISLARKVIEWEPKIPLKEGIAKTIPYFRKFS